MKQSLIILALFATASAFVPATRPSYGMSTAVRAESEKDWAAEINKMEKEAEDRLDEKVKELKEKLDKEAAAN
eukprot:CAMPEP_0194203528 /NCGR_PEP_ID=MMETSP0156-20130528/3268_1 /TAXON_ID=33649 /ORGANISM="Thalassionema nitzschioides, Strain L26-B" /LENGTH=72 /DNA_ID=CAMNT_0038929291 /DNA_START=42 /DNA_END=260 /DNA_ORIENTATION=+